MSYRPSLWRLLPLVATCLGIAGDGVPPPLVSYDDVLSVLGTAPAADRDYFQTVSLQMRESTDGVRGMPLWWLWDNRWRNVPSERPRIARLLDALTEAATRDLGARGRRTWPSPLIELSLLALGETEPEARSFRAASRIIAFSRPDDPGLISELEEWLTEGGLKDRELRHRMVSVFEQHHGEAAEKLRNLVVPAPGCGMGSKLWSLLSRHFGP